MHILAASSSYYRQTCYREMLEGLGHSVTIVSGGVECVELVRRQPPALLLLESPLFWGGCDGVLAALEGVQELRTVPIIVVSIGPGNADWFGLSRFLFDDFLVRLPTREELGRSIERCTQSAYRPHFLTGGRTQPAGNHNHPAGFPQPSIGDVACSISPSVKS